MIKGDVNCITLQNIIEVRMNWKKISDKKAISSIDEDFVWYIWNTRPLLYQLLIAYEQDMLKYPDLAVPVTFSTGTVFVQYGFMKSLIRKDLFDFSIFNEYFNLRNSIVTEKPIQYSFNDEQGKNQNRVLFSRQ